MTGFVGVLLDAWEEVRVHRSRVILSLIGIVLAVFAMTVTTAAGMIFGQIVQETAEREAGRSTTLTLQVFANDNSAARVDGFYDALLKRYGVTYASRVANSSLTVPAPRGAPVEPTDEMAGGGVVFDGPGPMVGDQPWQVNAVDSDYGIIHRFAPVSGRWLGAGDAELLAPSVVLNKQAVQALGLDPEKRAPFSAVIPGQRPKQVVVVGVLDRSPWMPTLWVLRADAADLVPEIDIRQGSLELWVPPERADQLTKEIDQLIRQNDLSGQVNPPFTDAFKPVLLVLQLLILGLSLFALFLGALGVLNVGVVTVRQRVREIGVRRALGASSGRIFAAVMLESVLATMLAGLLGIAAAVVVIKNFPYSVLPNELQLTSGVPFPMAAALEAFVAATLVGALVGLVPATIAVRSKVIDAIRY